jgi:flagellar biosynthesis anti-sigma factor FlgM
MNVFLHAVGSAVPLPQTKKSLASDGTETSRSGGTDTPNDSVEASLELRTLTENVMSTPIVSQDRVNRIANAIATGHYEIDAQKAANRLVEFEFLAS